MKNHDKKNNCKKEHDVGNVQRNNLIDLNTNKFNAFSCEDEKEEEIEHYTMECEEEISGVMDKEELDDRDEMMSNDNEKEQEIINQVCKEVENNKIVK